jgi:NAD(P)-dependent dehydrogenase (short-subunit alcohol dehydrogenase family)
MNRIIRPAPDGRRRAKDPGPATRHDEQRRWQGRGRVRHLLGQCPAARPAILDYSTAKAALAAFCKALSKETGPHGIRVNTVSPGPVATDLWLGAKGVAQTVGAATSANPEDVARQAASQMATGRFTQPREVAELVLFLASSRADNITGADFTSDGGLVPTRKPEP